MSEPRPNRRAEDQPRPDALADRHPRMWLSDLSIRQPVFITMVVVAVIVVGGIFYTRMALELFPDISLPVAVVQTTYPGASPEEVERSLTKPIEDAVVSANGVESVRSTSLDSVSLVIVEFDMAKDGKEAADEVRTRVNAIRNSLPSDVGEPQILRFDFGSAPVLSLAVADASGASTPEQLRIVADDVLKPRLEKVAGVAAVEVVGGPVKEVHVELDRAQLEAHGIPPQAIVQAIRADNVDVPAGRVPEDGREELLRARGTVGSLDELGDIPVATRPGDEVIRLRNVARIAESQAEVRSVSRLDGQDSIAVNVRKQSGTNTVRVADGVKAELANLEAEYPDLRLAVAFDQSTFTRESVEDVQFSLVLGALLAAVVVLLFFRDVRNTLVTVAGLPVVILGTFAVMQVIGISLNMISLMALSLSVGMLIDDAIVVRENILRHTEAGCEPKVAAARGTAEIALAVLAVTSTIVAVFLPIAFTQGLAGEFFRDFGITVAVAVLISLVEAFTLAPMLSAYFFRRRLAPRAEREEEGRTAARSLSAAYRALLGWSLSHRFVVVLLVLLSLVGSGVILSRMAFSFSPRADQGDFGIAIELPPGTRLSDTDDATRAAEAILRGAPEVEHVFSTVGSADGAVEKATLTVKLRERGHTDAVTARLRPALERALAGGKMTIDQQSNNAMFGGGAAVGAVRGRPIQFSVTGEDFELLDRVSADLAARLEKVPGLVDVDRSVKPRRPGQSIVIDRDRAAAEGVTAAQVGSTLRLLVNGERAGLFRGEERDLDIVVRLDESDRGNLADVLRLPVATTRGDQIELSSVARLAESDEPSQIERENRLRQVVVGAGYEGRGVGAVLADARAAVAEMSLPAGVTVGVSGQAKSQDEMFASLGIALGLSVLFVYMILASQFGSFVHPFTIMLALPLSIVGALLGLHLFGFSFDMLAMIGIILLMGLVTKNSILLVEFTNQLRRRGLSTREAILEAGPVRLRPILMTTLAMIFGMLPVAAGIGAGAELRQPMGVSVVGGLITSTLLTLVVVPVAYSMVDDLVRLVTRRDSVGRRATEDAEPEPPRRRAALPFGVRRVGALALVLAVASGVVAYLATPNAAGRSFVAWPVRGESLTTPAPATTPPATAVRAPEALGTVDLAVVDPIPTPSLQPQGMPPMPPAVALPPSAAAAGAAAPTPPSRALPASPVASGVQVGNTNGLGVNVRAGPGTGAARVGGLPEGAPLTRLGETAETGGRVWEKVQAPSGAVGWVARDYLKPGGGP